MASLVEETDAEERGKDKKGSTQLCIDNSNMENDGRKPNISTGIRRLTKKSMQLTNNFNESRIIGEGSFGHVYRGINKNPEEREYAIKVLSDELLRKYNNVFGEEHAGELRITFNHQSIVNIVGYCQHSNERYIIYSFLKWHIAEKLRDEIDPLLWHQRLCLYTRNCYPSYA